MNIKSAKIPGTRTHIGPWHVTSPPLFGTQPELTGLVLESLRTESYLCHGELVSAANAVFVKVSGAWHRVVIDAGTVHWQVQDEEPRSWAVADSGWSYPHRDVGDEFGLSGATFSHIATSQAGEATRVEFQFTNGKRFVLINTNDRSTYHVA